MQVLLCNRGVLIIIKWAYFFDLWTFKIDSAFLTFITFKGRLESKNKPRHAVRLGKIYILTKFHSSSSKILAARGLDVGYTKTHHQKTVVSHEVLN